MYLLLSLNTYRQIHLLHYIGFRLIRTLDISQFGFDINSVISNSTMYLSSGPLT